MTDFAHWMPCRTLKMRPRAVQKKSEYESLRNPVEKLGRCEWTNWWGKCGQTGGAAKSALASTWNDLRKWWGCLGLGHVVQNPMMYDTWGGASHFFSARSLRSKIPCYQGIRSPNWHSCQLGNLSSQHPSGMFENICTLCSLTPPVQCLPAN